MTIERYYPTLASIQIPDRLVGLWIGRKLAALDHELQTQEACCLRKARNDKRAISGTLTPPQTRRLRSKLSHSANRRLP